MSHQPCNAPSLTEKPALASVGTALRVRYGETDQMGTFYNARVLDWFECGRTEWFRAMGQSYTAVESRGVFLPIVESHVRYRGRARYDDLLAVETWAGMSGRARVRFDVRITHDSRGGGDGSGSHRSDDGEGRDEHKGGAVVAEGYTIHAVTDANGRAIRPPGWLVAVMNGER